VLEDVLHQELVKVLHGLEDHHHLLVLGKGEEKKRVRV